MDFGLEQKAFVWEEQVIVWKQNELGKLYFIIGFSRSVVNGLEGYATVR